MATPSSAPRPATISTPTPKGHPVTPSNTHLTSPAAVAMARQFSASHRSPSTKTPGHAHNLSTSSHPGQTPMAAGATPLAILNLGDDGAALNSPAAALLAGLGAQGTGFTPAAAGLTQLGMGSADQGLGISNAPELQMGGTQTDGNSLAKDPEAERERRLGDMLNMLKDRVAGRGVCREAIERLARLVGLTFLWQDDTLTIAGNSVDLEIDFYPESQRVRDVSLKIATNAEVEAEGKEEASIVLKKDLMQENNAVGWKDLDGFANNLERLGRLDRLSQGVNCFEAVEGLHESFRKIWAEEKKRLRGKNAATRLSKGAIGRPVMHKGRRLGLGLEYWASAGRLAEYKRDSSQDDAMDTDNEDDVSERTATIWSGRIECESGFPSIRVSKDWVSVDALQNANTDTLEEPLPNAWLDPPPTMMNANEDAMETDGAATSNLVQQPPNVRFVLELEPEVLLPMAVAPNIFSNTGVNLVRDRGTMKDVHDYVRGLMPSLHSGNDSSGQGQLRWIKKVTSFNEAGDTTDSKYRLMFNTNGPFWCYSVQSVAFDHPRQLAGLFPTLRQYAMLWTLIQSTVKDVHIMDDTPAEPKKESISTNKNGIKKRSNVNPQKAKLAELLKDRQQTPSLPAIDINLRFSTGQQPQPMLDVRFPLHRDLSKLTLDAPTFGSVCIEIALGGQIQISKCENMPFARTAAETQKMGKILEVCEDITILVAWVHERLERMTP